MRQLKKIDFADSTSCMSKIFCNNFWVSGTASLPYCEGRYIGEIQSKLAKNFHLTLPLSHRYNRKGIRY